MSLTLLVTGGAGFIGSHMVRQLLQQGHEVVVYDNLKRGNRDAVPADTLEVGDLRDKPRLSTLFQRHDFHAVLHFAALAYVGESVSDPASYYNNNVAGSLALMDTMCAHDVKRLVFSSTCATYGEPAHLPITEKTPQHPINPYGHSKLMVEQVLKDYATAYQLQSVALRYFNAAGCATDGSIGERHDPETHLLPLILLEALRVRAGGDPAQSRLKVFGNDFQTRDGTCVRDYIHVEDLCSAHVAALTRLMKNESFGAEQYNLGTNQGYTVLEVINACRRVTGVEFQHQQVARRAGDPPELIADASLAMKRLGWTPKYADIEHSIQHAWNWFVAHETESVAALA